MRMGITDQLELFGAGCCPATTLPAWAPPTPCQIIRQRIKQSLAQPTRRDCPLPSDEDPERWDGLS